MRQALGPGALGRPWGSGWRGRWEGGSGWGTHVNPWLFHFNVWQNPLQKKKRNVTYHSSLWGKKRPLYKNDYRGSGWARTVNFHLKKASLGNIFKPWKTYSQIFAFHKSIIVGHILSFGFLKSKCILIFTTFKWELVVNPISSKYQLNINCISVFINISIQVCDMVIMISNLTPYFHFQ